VTKVFLWERILLRTARSNGDTFLLYKLAGLTVKYDLAREVDAMGVWDKNCTPHLGRPKSFSAVAKGVGAGLFILPLVEVVSARKLTPHDGDITRPGVQKVNYQLTFLDQHHTKTGVLGFDSPEPYRARAIGLEFELELLSQLAFLSKHRHLHTHCAGVRIGNQIFGIDTVTGVIR